VENEPPTTEDVADVSRLGGGDDPAVDDEPSFEVEPLQPFVETDQLPTGWAAFDFNLSDALLRNGNTAASVAVSIDGEVVHRAAMGARTPRAGDVAEPQDRFRIASISKTLTAIALLQLVEDGVVGLDEPVGRRVAAHVGVTDPSARTQTITPRHLLNHTAGFGKYQSVFFGGQAADCTEAARIGLSRSTNGTPGGSYNYSNMNYCVAGQLIEALTGRDYDDVVYAEVLAPLGISGPRLADTFDPGPDEILHPTTLGRNYMEALGPAGGWIATPEDLVTVLDSLDPTTPGYKPLEPATLELMKTAVGGQRGQRGYGLGLLLYGGERYGHTGTIESTHAMAMNRGDGVTWAITVSGPSPDDTPRLESIINRAFVAGGFVTG
jgi:D-alanyl-D-alanine carboxypeptidase